MSAKSGSLSIACVQLGPRKLSVIRSSGVSAIQGLQVLKLMEGQSGLSELSFISWVSVKRGSTVNSIKLRAVFMYCYISLEVFIPYWNLEQTGNKP